MPFEHQISGASETVRPPAQLLGVIRGRAQSLIGTLAWLSGEAEIRDSQTRLGRPARQGLRLSRQCALVVNKGHALVRLDDGSDLWVSAGTQIGFTHWDAARRGFELVMGRVLSLVAPDAARPFSVVSNAARILVTGTAFEAEALEQRLDVRIFHGSVECRAPSGQVRARRGYQVSIPMDGRPELRRIGCQDPRSDPAMLLALSSENAKIKGACRAVGKILRIHPREGEKTNWREKAWYRWLVTLILVIALVMAFERIRSTYRAMNPPNVPVHIVTPAPDVPVPHEMPSGICPKCGKPYNDPRYHQWVPD